MIDWKEQNHTIKYCMMVVSFVEYYDSCFIYYDPEQYRSIKLREVTPATDELLDCISYPILWTNSHQRNEVGICLALRIETQSPSCVYALFCTGWGTDFESTGRN